MPTSGRGLMFEFPPLFAWVWVKKSRAAIIGKA